MTKSLYTLLLLCALSTLSFAQERYLDKVFDEVTVTADVQYGTNVSIIAIVLGIDSLPQPENLFMDIYEPVGDTLAERPVVIFAHRGDFLPAVINQSPYGTKGDSAVVEMCRDFAKRGFVAVSMDYRLGWNPFGDALEIKRTVLEASYRISQDMRNAVRFLRKTAAEDDNPYRISDQFAVGGFDAAGFAANSVAYLKRNDQTLLPKFLDFGTMPPTPFIIEEVHGNPYGTNEALLNIPNFPNYSSDVSAVIDFEGGLGDFSWIEAGDPPTISFQAINKFDNAGIRDVTIGVGGSIIIDEGAFPDTIVHQTQALGNQDIFINAGFDDELTQRATSLTGGLEGLYLYTPFRQEGSVQCDSTAGVPAVGYGGNTYAWNWYNEQIFAAIWDMVPGQTVPADLFICQYNTSEGNPNDPMISRMMIDTLQRYIAPRLVVALGLNQSTAVQLSQQEVNFQVFPNPGTDLIRVQADDPIQRIDLFDLQGRLVSQKLVDARLTSIEVANLPEGLYTIRATLAAGLVTEKLLVGSK